MSLPTGPSPSQDAPSPRRVLLESPLASAGWIRSRRQQRQRDKHIRGLRWIALLGTMLLHTLFLAVFVLGPPYDWHPPPSVPDEYLQVRLIDADELLPRPPPVPGTLPKQVGPRHQGRAATAAAAPTSELLPAAQPASRPRTAARSLPMSRAQPPARVPPTPPVVAARQPPASTPAPALPSMPQLQPVPIAEHMPDIAVVTPTLQPSPPPKFQPQTARPIREEGQQPVPPPASLALPEVPSTVPPAVTTPMLAVRVEVPRTSAPSNTSVVRAQAMPAPPASDMQRVPLPAPLAPAVNLQAQVQVSMPVAATDLQRVQEPALAVAQAPLQAVPIPSMDAVRIAAQTAGVKVSAPDAAAAQSTQAIPRVVVAASPAPVADKPAPAPGATLPTAAAAASSIPVVTPAAPDAQAGERTAATSAVATPADISAAPDATPQGQDDAVLGAPASKSVSASDSRPGAAPAQNARAPSLGFPDARSSGELAGRSGAQQPGAARGERRGTPGSYIQLKPSGDMEVMQRSAPNIGYKPTRFEGDWTPYGESSIDTALRRAVEKTTVEHTFHLPRGIRFKCVLMPLVPMSLGGCGAADPPPAPVAAKVYDRLHMAPANPVAVPTPVVDTAPATMPTIKLDNAAQCAAARISGGPPPPNCAATVKSLSPARDPAAASSSWLPVSDQFH